MNTAPDKHPATHPNPVEGGFREVLECFSDWLETLAPNGSKPYRILAALAQESLKKAESERASRQFDARDITCAMGEEEGTNQSRWFEQHGNKSQNEWLDWSATVERFMTLRAAALIEFARRRGLTQYPYPQRHPTRGGPGNRTTYEIVARPIQESDSGSEAAQPENVIQYEASAVGSIKPAWFLRGWFRHGELRLTRWNRRLLILGFVGLVVFTYLITFGAYHELQKPEPLTRRDIAILINLIVIPLATWLYLVRPFSRLLNDRIMRASDLLLAAPYSAQMELYKDQEKQLRVIRFVRYTGTCLICGAEVELDKGEPDYPRRLVGRCSESPREHVFSSDRVSRRGKMLRGELLP